MSESIREQLARLESEARDTIAAAADTRGLESVRVRFLGKKGSLTQVLRGMAALDASERPAAGKLVNSTKDAIQEAITVREAELGDEERRKRLEGPPLDVSLPSYGPGPGRVHPLMRTMAEICEVLSSLGFSIADGPDVEDEYHNFEALNIPADHPARDMQDTFFVEGGGILRTHTSPVQIRVMERSEPPLAIIAPGAVYRHDDDVTHSPMFHQIEGLLVDEGVNFGHLKHVLTVFLRTIFGEGAPVRFRASYFPFTEPSAEVDVGCVICAATGEGERGTCRVCKGTGWLEILGSGMVHPAVFEHVGYDPEVYTGFAFGIGVERIAMLRYGIADIRLFYANDSRFLRQF
jgi:phenylalanyl-tRNA synthetase alpha chain